MSEHAGWRPGQLSFRELTKPDPFYEHGRRLSYLIAPNGRVIEVADESGADWCHLLFQEVYSDRLNAPKEKP